MVYERVFLVLPQVPPHQNTRPCSLIVPGTMCIYEFEGSISHNYLAKKKKYLLIRNGKLPLTWPNANRLYSYPTQILLAQKRERNGSKGKHSLIPLSSLPYQNRIYMCSGKIVFCMPHFVLAQYIHVLQLCQTHML